MTCPKRGDGVAALDRAKADQPDLVILDLNLPLLSGVEVFRRLRATGNTPVIMLTARVNEVDRVVGLELGADDYVGKPFSPREVVARVKTVLRRYRSGDERAGSDAPVQRIGSLEIDREGHEARLEGRRINLTPTEFRTSTCSRTTSAARSRAISFSTRSRATETTFSIAPSTGTSQTSDTRSSPIPPGRATS